jgi:hypothetical protein
MEASRIRHVAVALCLAALGAWLFHAIGTHASTRPMAHTAVTASPQPRTATPRTGPALAGHAVLANDPLPPADAPVVQVFDGLKQRADAGDAHAACRLAVELLGCRNLPLMQMVAGGSDAGGDDNEAAFARKGNLAAANFFAQMKLSALDAQQRCSNVSATQTALVAPYLRQAARAGIKDAIVRYVDGQGFDPRSMFGVLQDPSFDAWRREAPALALRALHQGNPAAVVLLYSAYSGDGALFAGLVRDDPVQARAYRILLERLHNRSPRPDASLTPEQQEAADALAAGMYHDDFHGQPLPDSEIDSAETATRNLLAMDTPDCR